MFWGKGDTSKLSDDEQKTLRHLRRLEETEHIVALNADKAQVAMRAIEFFDGWESAFRLLSGGKNVAVLVGSLLVIYWATNDWIVEFIRSAVEGAP